MTSVEFRKSYAKLTAPTIVTVLGRPIGTWVPSGTENQVVVTNAIGTPMKGLTVEVKPLPVHVAPLPAPRPFTPAPKPGKR